MKRHRFDPFSLLFGALFLSVGASFLAGSTLPEAWHGVGPMVAVVVGATLAAWAAATAFRDRRPRSGPAQEEPTEQETEPSGSPAA